MYVNTTSGESTNHINLKEALDRHYDRVMVTLGQQQEEP
jgi:hypothetical protein